PAQGEPRRRHPAPRLGPERRQPPRPRREVLPGRLPPGHQGQRPPPGRAGRLTHSKARSRAMATATLPPAAPPTPLPALRLHRMSYETYERIIEAGIFGPNDKIVLLDG